MGFEPTRAEHIGLAVQRLNHSATASCDNITILLNFRSFPNHKIHNKQFLYLFEIIIKC